MHVYGMYSNTGPKKSIEVPGGSTQPEYLGCGELSRASVSLVHASAKCPRAQRSNTLLLIFPILGIIYYIGQQYCQRTMWT